MRLTIATVAAALFVASLAQAEVPPLNRVPAAMPGFPDDVRAVLQKHCFACHGEKKQKGDIRLDTLSIDFLKDAAAAETWHDALNAVSKGEMPPEKEPRPTEQERGILTGWIRKNLDTASAAANRDNEGVVMRRLNNDEYRFTMTDLLGVPGKHGENLPADPLSKDGFANNGAMLGMTALQTEIYLESARVALAEVLVDGPQPKRSESSVVTKSARLRGTIPSAEGNILDRAGVFVATLTQPEERDNVPMEGRFTIRVKARAEFKAGQPAPILRVVYGFQSPGGRAVYQDVGAVKISDASTRVYDFSGPVHHFPNVRPQCEESPSNLTKARWRQIAVLDNILDDGGREAPLDLLRAEKNCPKVHDPSFPRIIVESVQIIGNDDPQWPPAEHRRILFAARNEGTPEYAREVLHRFLSRAWRRPATDAEVAKYHAHFVRLTRQPMSFVAAMRETLAVALASPDFLYLVEPRLKKDAARPLDSYELASRLSYFLWSSMPDDTLFTLAAKGTLTQPQTLAAQVQRMLADPKSQRFVQQFTTQWLDLDGLARVAINPQYYPGFKDKLKSDMIGETQAYFAEILRSGSSALQFLDSDWTMLNASLAKHYGLQGPKSQAFERVSLKGTQRPGGLLGHASVLLANSNGEDSHPIKRAIWIRERLLNDPPLPPPPNVPPLPAEDPDFAKRSIREQLQLHRKDPACADCHRSIDPWGVALDHFDAVGLWRDVIRRPSGKTVKGHPVFAELPVDAKDALPGGVALDGMESLKTYLLQQRKDQVTHALVTKFLAYALGRSVGWTDQAAVQRLTQRFNASGHKLAVLIADIAASEPFLKP